MSDQSMDDIEQSLKRIAAEKRSIESEFPRTGDPNSTGDAYLHGKWRGLKFALDVLQEGWSQ
jgi:hypothetical protein